MKPPKKSLENPFCTADIALSFSKMSRRGVFHATKQGVMISNVGASVSSTPLLWAVIDKTDFFEQYDSEGANAENDEIVLTFHAGNSQDKLCVAISQTHSFFTPSTDQFAIALNMLRNFVKVLKLKLTNKQFPCLTIDTEVVTAASNTTRRLVHDVPVIVIPVKEWMDYMVPKQKEYEVSGKHRFRRSITNLVVSFFSQRYRSKCLRCGR